MRSIRDMTRRELIAEQEAAAAQFEERFINSEVLASALNDELWLEEVSTLGVFSVLRYKRHAKKNELWQGLQIPREFLATVQGMQLWEWELRFMCESFLQFRKPKAVAGSTGHRLDVIRSEHIGKKVAELLRAGAFGAPRFVSECLIKISNREPQKAQKMRLASLVNTRVLIAFFYLEKKGTTKPSQSEVLSLLKRHGQKISKQNVSKVFARLELKAWSSYGRENQSAAGKRRCGIIN